MYDITLLEQCHYSIVIATPQARNKQQQQCHFLFSHKHKIWAKLTLSSACGISTWGIVKQIKSIQCPMRIIRVYFYVAGGVAGCITVESTLDTLSMVRDERLTADAGRSRVLSMVRLLAACAGRLAVLQVVHRVVKFHPTSQLGDSPITISITLI